MSCSSQNCHTTNAVIEWLSLVIRIRHVWGSNRDLGTSYPLKYFRGSYKSFRASARQTTRASGRVELDYSH